MKTFASLAVAVTLVFFRVDLAAQQPTKPEAQEAPAGSSSSTPREATEKLTVHSNLIFLPTRVQKKNGETIYGLKPEQFIIEDNGTPQSVRIEEAPKSEGLSLAVVVQCSRFAPSEFDKLRNLGTMIAGIVGDGPHEVAVMSYGEAPYLLSNFSSRSEAVQSGLARLKPCGSDAKAPTVDAVYYALGMLKRRKNQYRRAILLISENRDHGSHSKLEDVVAELGVTDTVIYSVTFSAGKDAFIKKLRYPRGRPQPEPEFKPWPLPSSSPQPTPSPQPSLEETLPPEPVYLVHPPLIKWDPRLLLAINALRRNSASELASLSGGEYMNFSSQKGLEDDLQRVSNRIHNYYLLSFTPPSVPTLGLHSLKVRVPDYPDAFIQTRKSYWSGIIEGPFVDGRSGQTGPLK
jgi:VWFA-related protein